MEIVWSRRLMVRSGALQALGESSILSGSIYVGTVDQERDALAGSIPAPNINLIKTGDSVWEI